MIVVFPDHTHLLILRTFLAFKRSDVVFIMLLNVKMTTTVVFIMIINEHDKIDAQLS